MQKTKKQISIATALVCSVLSFNLQAQTCVDAPDCKTLGYQFTQKECEGMSSVKCPYDDSYYFCIQGSTDAYDSNIGDILYDDFTTSPNIITNKKPIGVVFTTGRDVNYAIALNNVENNEMKQLYSYSTATVPNYTTKGTIFGDWELPDMSLMQIAYYNKDKLNETLNRVGGAVLTGSYKTKTGNISMVDGATSTESGVLLRSIIKLNPPAGKSYTYTLENCSDIVAGDIYHGKFEKCRTTPMVGDYITNDKKFTAYTGELNDSNLTKVLGVVFDTENRLAVALTDIKEDGSEGREGMYWSSYFCDVPNLENCSDKSTALTTCGIDGRANTDAILAANGGNCGITYAANAVNAYQPENCTAEFCQKGKWFLPSLRDLFAIYTLRDVIGSASLTAQKLSMGTDRYYWSSTKDGTGAWKIKMGSGYIAGSNEINKVNYVRPVLAF